MRKLSRFSRKVEQRLFPHDRHIPAFSVADKEYLFLHINKTAGTSICQSLGLNDWRHFNVKEVIDIWGNERVRQAHKFAVIRNPWERIASLFAYRIRKSKLDLQSTKDDFLFWLQQVYQEKNEQFYDYPRMLQSQCLWLSNYESELLVDSLIRFENLSEEWKLFTSSHKMDAAPLPHLNKGIVTDYHALYSVEAYDIIVEYFADDIKHFGYTFEMNQ